MLPEKLRQNAEKAHFRYNLELEAITVHLKCNKLGFKEHLAFNEQSISPLFPPSLTLLKHLASNELISDPSKNYKYWQIHYRMLF